MSQDVVFQEQLIPPQALGLSPETTEIQIWTEFLNFPQPTRRSARDEQKRREFDSIIDFGGIKIIEGFAHMAGERKTRMPATRVRKEWVTAEGRTFLVESVDYSAVRGQLDKLPANQQANANLQEIRRVTRTNGGVLPPRELAARPGKAETLQFAAIKANQQGFVLDYETVVYNINEQHLVFKGDQTYYVPDGAYASMVTIEGGAVIKLGEIAPGIQCHNVFCETDAYRPAFITSKHDDSVGEWIPGSNGLSDFYYPDIGLWAQFEPRIENLRIKHTWVALILGSESQPGMIKDVQFIDCAWGVTSFGNNLTVQVDNCLFKDCKWIFGGDGDNCSIPATHLTISNAELLGSWWSGSSSTLSLVNCILADVDSLGSGFSSMTGSYNGFYNSPQFGTSQITSQTAPFQTGGSGHFYLKEDSVFRRAGSTSVFSGFPGAALLARLKNGSTQPPLELPSYLEVPGELTLSRQVSRYTDGQPDLGYYYPALDYTVGPTVVQGGSISVLPGTAIGLRNDDWYVFWLWEGSTFYSHGTPANPNTFAALQFVQEGASSPGETVAFRPDYWPQSPLLAPPYLNFRFSNFHLRGEDFHLWSGVFWDWYAQASLNSAVYLKFQDCSLYNGRLVLGTPDDWFDFFTFFGPSSISWQNNLFERVNLVLDPTFFADEGEMNVDLEFRAHNNLFRGGRIFVNSIPATLGNWEIKDNIFDKVAFEFYWEGPLDHDYNAYSRLLTSELESWQTDRLEPAASNDRLLTSPVYYQEGPLGNRYLPTSSSLYQTANRGSRTAAQAGLFHHTTRLNQTKNGNESANVVIGRHYVATYASNNSVPVDSDTDSLPDYFEDANGNGIHDSGEPSVTTADANADSNGDGWTNLQKWQQGVDPSKYKFDADGDGLAHLVEFWFGTSPFNAYSVNSTRKDGEYHLTATTGQSGTRVSISVDSAVYDSGSDTTELEFIVNGAFSGERHGIYLYDVAGQYWKNLTARHVQSTPSGELYHTVARGNQTASTFAAFSNDDFDFDGLPDGYELNGSDTVAGQSDSRGVGIPDGFLDTQGDGLTLAQKWSYGLNPFSPVSNADSDADGIPDWLEDYIKLHWGLTDVLPWADTDGDGLPNLIEFEIGSNPAFPDYGGYFPPPPNPDAEFVSFQLNDVPYGMAAQMVAGNSYFPTAGLSLGPLGVTAGMTVIPSDFNGPGVAEVKFDIMPLQDFYFNVFPFTDDGTPTQFELQRPDPDDGTDYRALLLQITSFAGEAASFAETVWGEIDETVLQALRQRTLEYVSATTKIKISYLCREIQWLQHYRLQVGDHPAIRLAILRRLSLVHAEITKTTAIHLEYVDRYPTQGARYLGKILKGVQWLSFAVSLPSELQAMKERIYDYLYDVRNQQDTAGPALLSLQIQSFVSSIPGMPSGLISTTTPLFDPCPLGFYEGGSGQWGDCLWHY